MNTVISIGYKGEHGQIVVTDVLCHNFPPLTPRQIADLSWKLEQFSRELYKIRQLSDHET